MKTSTFTHTLALLIGALFGVLLALQAVDVVTFALACTLFAVVMLWMNRQEA